MHSLPSQVTILPTGESLGHTALIPQTEQYNQTRSQLLAALDTLMGGRAAEELIFGSEKVTAGTSSDLEAGTYDILSKANSAVMNHLMEFINLPFPESNVNSQDYG